MSFKVIFAKLSFDPAGDNSQFTISGFLDSSLRCSKDKVAIFVLTRVTISS